MCRNYEKRIYGANQHHTSYQIGRKADAFGRLFTPPANRYILGGITRKFVLALANQLGLSVSEREVEFTELANIDEVFMTSTTLHIQPVSRIIATEAHLPYLTIVASSPRDTLLVEPTPSVTIWQSQAKSQVTDRLRAAFAEEIARFYQHTALHTETV